MLLDDDNHTADRLGYRFIPYIEKFNDHFDFFHIKGKHDLIVKHYKIENIPSILVFNKIKDPDSKEEKIRIAPYSKNMSIKPLEEFLLSIIKILDQ